MAPATAARNFVPLDPNNITIFYPADTQSDTALAYRNEELARQSREPGYVPACFQIDNPLKEHDKIIPEGDLEIDLKRKLCDFLGYSEEDVGPNKAQRHEGVSRTGHSHHDALVQRAQQPARHINSELISGFADAARHAASIQAAHIPQNINHDRYRNAPPASLAPPNPAMVTRQLHTPVARHAPQSCGQGTGNHLAPQNVLRQPTPSSRPQARSEAQDTISIQAAAELRQHSNSSVPWVPQRVDSPQVTWLENAATQAKQPQPWAGSPQGTHRPSSPNQPAEPHVLHLSADGKYWVAGSVGDKFLRPPVAREPSRTTEQLQQTREKVEQMRRQQAEREDARKAKQESDRLRAERNAKTRAQEDARHRQNAAEAASGSQTVEALAAKYNFDLSAAAARPSAYPPPQRAAKSFATGTPPQHRLTPAHLEMTPERRNGSFCNQSLNELLPPALDDRGRVTHVPIGLSEEQIVLLISRTSGLRPYLEQAPSHNRRRLLQQFYESRKVEIRRWLQHQTPSPVGQTPSQQQESPSSYQQQHASPGVPDQRPSASQSLGVQQRQQDSGVPYAQHSNSVAAGRIEGAGTPSIPPSPAQAPARSISAQSLQARSPSVQSPPAQSDKSDPNAPGVKVGTDPIPVEIQQIASAVKALPKTKDGLPARKGLKNINREYFSTGGTITRRDNGDQLLAWYRDDRLFTEEEWHWLRYTVPRKKVAGAGAMIQAP